MNSQPGSFESSCESFCPGYANTEGIVSSSGIWVFNDISIGHKAPRIVSLAWIKVNTYDISGGNPNPDT